MLKLSVIIVLYSEYTLVKKTIASIYKNEIKDMEVILVDNTPDNKGHESVLKQFPQVKYFHNPVNPGFGGGVNFGLSKAKGEYILILTPDMYILPRTIQETLKYIEKHKDVGMVGSRLFSNPKVQERSANSSYPNLLTVIFLFDMPLYKLVNRFNKEYNPNHFSVKAHAGILETKWINGQYMLARKKAFDEIKGFDERFFMYFEDVDLCKRLVEKGWKVVYLPVGGVVQNGLTGWKKTAITQSSGFYLSSLYKFYKKHYGFVYAFAAWGLGLLSTLVSLPYLSLVVVLKRSLGLKSQSVELLPLWVGIAKWHFSKGIKIVLQP
jgi:hypothetical protein